MVWTLVATPDGRLVALSRVSDEWLAVLPLAVSARDPFSLVVPPVALSLVPAVDVLLEAIYAPVPSALGSIQAAGPIRAGSPC